MQVHGYPEGAWLNLVSWSRDSRHVSFAIRSPGAPRRPPFPDPPFHRGPPVLTEALGPARRCRVVPRCLLVHTRVNIDWHLSCGKQEQRLHGQHELSEEGVHDRHDRFAMEGLRRTPCAVSRVRHTLSQAHGLSAGGTADPPRQPLELWVADAATGAARCLLRSPEQGLNAVFDECAPHHAGLGLGLGVLWTPSGAGLNAVFQWSRVTRLPLSRCCMQRVTTVHSWAMPLTRAACKIRPGMRR